MKLRNLTPEILASLLKEGNNYEDIGKKYGVTRQRIQQLAKQYMDFYPELFSFKKNLEIDKKILENYLNLPLTLKAIADICGIKLWELKKLLKEYGLKRVFIRDILTKEKLTELYVVKRMSDSRIAKEYNTSINTVWKLRNEYGIHEESKRPLKAILTEEIFTNLYETLDLSLAEISELLNVGIQSVIDIKNTYPNIKKRRSTGSTEENIARAKKYLIERGVIIS